MRHLKLLHIIVFCLLLFPAHGQVIIDRCFTSIFTGEDFSDGVDFANCSDLPEDAADLVKFQDDEWQGTSSNLSILPAYDCDNPRAVFMQVQGNEEGEGFGLRLGNGLQTGSSFTLELTYVSHGPGANGNFAPRIYTHHNSEFQIEGFINAQYVTSMPAVGNTWETASVTFNVTPAMAGDNWIFIYSDDSSGMVMNICQSEAGTVDLGPDEALQGCENPGLTIGSFIGDEYTYWWSTGATSATTTVTSTGTYAEYASNVCNTDEKIYVVTLFPEPNLEPEDWADVILCEGDSLELSSSGLNVTNFWPDGSSTPTYWINDEGMYEVTIEGQCGTVEYNLEFDYDTIPFVDLGPDRDLCEGQFLTLNGGMAGDVNYLWQDGSTDSTIIADHQEVYMLTVYNECGAYTDEVDIIYHLEPKDILPEIVYFCTARLPEFDLSHLDGTFEWSDGSTSSSYIAQFNGAHWVDFTDSYHCFTVRDSVIAHEEVCGCPIYMPNAFTPDGDGLNDVFKCEYECAPYDFTMEIYDRWGNVSFRTYSPLDGWDGYFQGEIAPTGVYHYRIWYRESFSGIPIEHFGNVTVLPGKL